MTSLADQFATDSAQAPAAPPKSVSQMFAADSAATNAPTQSVSSAVRGKSQSGGDFVGEADGASSIAKYLVHGLTSTGASIIGGWRGLGTLVTGGSLEDAADAVQEEQRRRTYTPDEDDPDAAVTQAMESKYSPLTVPGRVGGYLGGKVSELTGSPALATAVDVGTQLGLPLGVAKGFSKVSGLIQDRATPPVARVEPTMSPAPTTNPVTDLVPRPTQMASTLQNNPSPTLQIPRTSDAANGVFEQGAPDIDGGYPQSVQDQRAAILNEIGIQNARRSALTGDAKAASTDYQSSKLDTPAGNQMRAALDQERASLKSYADGIASDTGGSALNDQAAKYARGNTIVAPLEGLKDWFDSKTRALYKTADERAQGVPTDLSGFRTALGDDSLMTNSDRVQLRSAINSYAKKLGMMGDDGSVFANAQQAETMRKYLSENWSPQSSGMIVKLKDALDDDVTQAAGEDVYAQARQMRAMRGQTLDNPNGVAKLLDSDGPNGINRKVQVENISDHVTNMPADQLSHIIDTLKNAPDEIQPQAQAALSEIKAQFAHNVSDIGNKFQGQWNSRGVQKYLQNNSQRMNSVFSPEEMQKFGTLNDAGSILAKDQSYPGAAVQAHNLMRAGIASGIEHGATALGSTLGGPVGAMVGRAAGNRLASRFSDAADLRAMNKRFISLSDLVKAKPDQ